MFKNVSPRRKVLFGSILVLLLIAIIVVIWAFATGKISSKADSTDGIYSANLGPYTMNGILKHADNTPPIGGTVVIQYPAQGYRSPAIPVSTVGTATRPQGSFTIVGIPAGNYIVTGGDGCGASDPPGVYVTMPTTNNVTVTLPNSNQAMLTVNVKDQFGAAIPQANVKIENTSLSGQTDTNGVWKISGVVPPNAGSLDATVTASKSGYSTNSASFTIRGCIQVPVNITLQKQQSSTGIIQLDNYTLADAYKQYENTAQVRATVTPIVNGQLDNAHTYTLTAADVTLLRTKQPVPNIPVGTGLLQVAGCVTIPGEQAPRCVTGVVRPSAFITVVPAPTVTHFTIDFL